jgi:hypothetical protein
LRPALRLECATLPENSPSGVRRGHTDASVDRPVGCSGSAYQKPKPCDPAATLPRTVLSGWVIQKVAGRESEGSTASAAAGVRERKPRFPSSRLPVSIPSSRK